MKEAIYTSYEELPLFLNAETLAPLLAQTIKNEVESVEKNISSMLYKLSVEQAIVNN